MLSCKNWEAYRLPEDVEKLFEWVERQKDGKRMP
jgi:hypothetical protein